MANKIVKDSGLAIFVKEVQVAAAGTAATDVPKINDLFTGAGAKVGIIGDTPRKGEDGAFYATVDTAALVRIDGVTVALTDGQAVFITPGKAISTTASGNTLVGYADRPKTSASGPAFVQLVPRTA